MEDEDEEGVEGALDQDEQIKGSRFYVAAEMYFLAGEDDFGDDKGFDDGDGEGDLGMNALFDEVKLGEGGDGAEEHGQVGGHDEEVFQIPGESLPEGGSCRGRVGGGHGTPFRIPEYGSPEGPR